MRIKKREIQELNVNDLKNKTKDVVNMVKQTKQDLLSIGMSDVDAGKTIAGVLSSDNKQMSEINQSEFFPETGEDFGDIPTGQDVEVGADDYEEYQNILRSLGDEEGIKYNDNSQINDLPFESVRPKMTKNQLIETVLSNKNRRVIKTLRVKDIRK